MPRIIISFYKYKEWNYFNLFAAANDHDKVVISLKTEAFVFTKFQ